MSSLRDKIAGESGRKKVTTAELELRRICSLPIRDALSPEEVEEVSRQEIQAHHFDEGFRFFEPQARALLEWRMVGGLLGPIGVGWGKTLTLLLIAVQSLEDGAERVLLVVPPDVYRQLVNTDIPWARDRIDLAIPFHYLGMKSREERAYVANSGRTGCYIMPYTCLSTTDAWDLLTAIKPRVVLLDEAHNVKNRDSVRTGRLMLFLETAQPKLAAVSGTFTDKSVDDYHHLAKHALGENCPLPRPNDLALEWGAIIDAAASPSEANAGPIAPLMDWARCNFPGEDFPPNAEGFRKAYRFRLYTCPGVVSTGDADLGISLSIRNEPIEAPEERPGWKELQRLIRQVELEWISPSGDEIDYAFHKWQYLHQLNSGFYYRHFWPEVAEIAERRDWSEDEAAEMLARAKRLHERAQEYHKLVRKFLEWKHVPGMDSPFLVGGQLARYRDGKLDHCPVPDELYDAWTRMKDEELPGLPERNREAVRVCDYRVRAAVTWARANVKEFKGKEFPPGGLIWHINQEVGQWTHELLLEAGLPTIFCPAESELRGSDDRIRDPANRDKFIVTSTAHSTGKNIQFHQHALLLQCPRESTDLEQIIGRTHRNKQVAEAVRIDTCHTTAFDHMNFSSALVDALYQQQTLGARLKIIVASYDPLPRIYPSGFLRENGFQNRLLDRKQEAAFRERFQVSA